jgi:hypothetical protein
MMLLKGDGDDEKRGRVRRPPESSAEDAKDFWANFGTSTHPTHSLLHQIWLYVQRVNIIC